MGLLHCLLCHCHARHIVLPLSSATAWFEYFHQYHARRSSSCQHGHIVLPFHHTCYRRAFWLLVLFILLTIYVTCLLLRFIYTLITLPLAVITICYLFIAAAIIITCYYVISYIRITLRHYYAVAALIFFSLSFITLYSHATAYCLLRINNIHCRRHLSLSLLLPYGHYHAFMVYH